MLSALPQTPKFFPRSAARFAKFWEEVCDENGIGGSGKYCGDNLVNHTRGQKLGQIRLQKG
jgi:hypothetical protein